MNNNTIKAASLLAFIVLHSGCAWGSSPLKLEVKMHKTEYVLGENVYATLSITNTSSGSIRLPPQMPHDPLYVFNLNGNVDKACIPPPPQYTEALSDGWVLEAGKSKNVTVALNVDYGAVRAGSYSMVVNLDSSRYPKGLLKFQAEKIVTASNRLSFNISNPTGVDGLAFEKYKNRCNGVSDKNVAYEYPESYYAGEFLSRDSTNVLAPFVHVKATEQLLNAFINRSHEGLEGFQKEKLPLGNGAKAVETRLAMQKMIDASEKFTKAHSEFPYSGYLLAKGGVNALALGDFPHACSMLERSIKMGWIYPQSPRPETELQENKDGAEYVLSVLKDKGLCDKQQSN